MHLKKRLQSIGRIRKQFFAFLIRCPDRTLSQARKYIFDSLGAEYLESTVLDLESMLEESDNRTPLICLLSTGSDPSPQVIKLDRFVYKSSN